MSLNQEAENIIYKYLTDAMSKEDILAFDKYSKDELFMKELYKQSKIVNSLDTNRDNEVRSFISGLEGNNSEVNQAELKKESNVSKSSSKSSLIKILLLLLGIFLIGLVIGKNITKKNNASNLFAELYMPYPVEEIQRGTDSQLSLNYKEALKLYKKKEYSNALNLFKLENPVTNQNKLYQSICHMEQKEFVKADIILGKLSKVSDLRIAHEAQWYSVLSALVTKDEAKLKETIDVVLTNPKHPFYQSAIELNSKINK